MSNFNLVIHCQDLKDKDTFSKSDPRCKVNLVNAQTHKKVASLGCTETVNNDLNPQFRKTIDIPRQYCSPNTLHLNLLEFIVEDSDGLVNDKLGSAFISLSDVINSHDQSATRRLTGKGSITVFVDNKSSGSLSFMFRGIKIASMDFLGKSDPFFELIQRGHVLYKSEHVMNTKSPKWKGFEIGINRVKIEEELIVRVYDYDGPNSKPDFIGECQFRPDFMQKGQVNREIELQANGRGKSKGFLCVDQCQHIKSKNVHGGHKSHGQNINIYGNQNYGQNTTAPITYGQNPYAPRPANQPIPQNYGVPSTYPYPAANPYPATNPYPVPNAYPPHNAPQIQYPPHNAYPPRAQGPNAYPPQNAYPPHNAPPPQNAYPSQNAYPPQHPPQHAPHLPQNAYPPQSRAHDPYGDVRAAYPVPNAPHNPHSPQNAYPPQNLPPHHPVAPLQQAFGQAPPQGYPPQNSMYPNPQYPRNY